MTYLAVALVALVLAAGFLASLIPGLGMGPLWEARLRLAEAVGARQNLSALIGVMRIALLMTVAGVLRLTAFAAGAAMILTESLMERPTPNEIDDMQDENEIRGEIENGC